MSGESFDLVILGGGPGGYVAAIKAAQSGMSVALVEERQLGGTCLNRGCIPTKALLHAGKLYQEILEGEAFGITAGTVSYSMEKIHARKEQVVLQLREGVSQLLIGNGVQVFSGRGQLLGGGLVQVTGPESLTLTGKYILLATGAKPASLPIPGIENCISSDEILESPRDYKSLAVIGGGVIGMEMATVYSNLGCQVTVIEAADRILPHMDREIAQNLGMILKKKGVEIHTAARVGEIKKTEEDLVLQVQGKKEPLTIVAQGALLAAGRCANGEGLLGKDSGLELHCDRGGIVVNQGFETSLPGVFAIGDCVSGNIQLAHVASAQGANVVSLLLGKEPELDLHTIPGGIYTNPEIACVGLTADQAKEQGIPVKTSKYIMGSNGKSLIENQERGFVKLVFHEESQKLLGAQLMCGRATDLVSELTAAVTNGLTATDMARIIHPHPSFSEGVQEAVEDFFGAAVHVMPKRKPGSR